MDRKTNTKGKMPAISRQGRVGPITLTSSAEMSAYVRQFLLPPEAGGDRALVVSPSSYPSQVCVRHLHKVVDVTSATASMANGFTVIMNPDLVQPGFLTASATTLVPPVATGNVSVRANLPLTVGTAADDTTQWDALVAQDGAGNSAVVNLLTIPDSAALAYPGFHVVPTLVDQTVTLTLDNKSKDAVTVIVNRKLVGGAWALAAQQTLAAHQKIDLNFDFPINSDSISFVGSGTADSSRWFEATLAFPNVQVTAATPQTYAPAFNRFIIDEKVTDGRVISMSILATNTSPDLANGGSVNAARVPRRLNPFNGIAQALADLPDNRRYQGPASDGAYVTWMPTQFDEYEVDSVHLKEEQLAQAEYLLVNVQGWGGANVSSFRLQFDWVVEFYTPNQLFEKVLTPPRTPEFDALYHLLLSMPAATCNPGHLDLLKSFFQKAGSMSKKALGFYKDHGKLIDAALLALTAM